MNEKNEIIEKIKEQIEMIKPFIINEGGILEFEKFEDGIVYITLGGACANCSMIDYTLKEGIEQIITSEIEEVKEVRRIEN
ncbi:MAG: NifU family protein [Bacilli bacterium]|nr:NifU family protein [Bacilli bacterium]